jgi:hypothetical protein
LLSLSSRMLRNAATHEVRLRPDDPAGSNVRQARSTAKCRWNAAAELIASQVHPPVATSPCINADAANNGAACWRTRESQGTAPLLTECCC